MRKARIVCLLTIGVMAVVFPEVGGAEKKEPPSSQGSAVTNVKNAGKDIVWPAEDIKYIALSTAVSQAVLWGDPKRSAYGALTKFAAGTTESMHSRVSDVKIIVVSGEFIYGTESGGRNLRPGSYLFIPKGREHIVGAGTAGECLIFEDSSGRYERLPADAR